MRQIYLLASDADAQAAGEISDLLAQRGYQVRRADEALAFPPARPHEITLALWSRNVELSAKQILFTNRAIDAWTEGRLIFARLDHAMLPRGLGDVDVIDTVPSDQLVVHHVGDGWGPICEHFGLAVPDAPFPSSNSTEDFLGGQGRPTTS